MRHHYYYVDFSSFFSYRVPVITDRQTNQQAYMHKDAFCAVTAMRMMPVTRILIWTLSLQHILRMRALGALSYSSITC